MSSDRYAMLPIENTSTWQLYIQYSRRQANRLLLFASRAAQDVYDAATELLLELLLLLLLLSQTNVTRRVNRRSLLPTWRQLTTTRFISQFESAEQFARRARVYGDVALRFGVDGSWPYERHLNRHLRAVIHWSRQTAAATCRLLYLNKHLRKVFYYY